MNGTVGSIIVNLYDSGFKGIVILSYNKTDIAIANIDDICDALSLSILDKKAELKLDKEDNLEAAFEIKIKDGEL